MSELRRFWIERMEDRLVFAGDVDDDLFSPSDPPTIERPVEVRPTNGAEIANYQARMEAMRAEWDSMEGVEAFKLPPPHLLHSTEHHQLLVVIKGLDGGGNVGSVYLMGAAGGLSVGTAVDGPRGTAFEFSGVPTDDEFLLVVDRRDQALAARDYVLSTQFDTAWSEFDGRMWDSLDGQTLGNSTLLSLSQDRQVSMHWNAWAQNAPADAVLRISLWSTSGQEAYQSLPAYQSPTTSGVQSSMQMNLSAGTYRLEVRALSPDGSSVGDVSHTMSIESTSAPIPIGSPPADPVEESTSSSGRSAIVSTPLIFLSSATPPALTSSASTSEAIGVSIEDVMTTPSWESKEDHGEVILSRFERGGDAAETTALDDDLLTAQEIAVDAFFAEVGAPPLESIKPAERGPASTETGEATVLVYVRVPRAADLDAKDQPLLDLSLSSAAVPTVLAPQDAVNALEGKPVPPAEESGITGFQAAAGAALGGWIARRGRGRRAWNAVRRRIRNGAAKS